MQLRLLRLLHGGETESAQLLQDQEGRQWVLKAAPGTPDAAENLKRLTRQLERLREIGYPAPAYVAVGSAGEIAYSVQERLPGRPIEPAPGQAPDAARLAALLPQLLELNELQMGMGDLRSPPWPMWLFDTLDHGGNGYCLHETMRTRADTAAMLDRIREIVERCRRSPLPDRDIVHFDFSYANILAVGDRITGVIDWSIPFTGAGQGDRAFDIATLLFYAYDLPGPRAALWRALRQATSVEAAAIYLCHLTLRQVEWSVRRHPDTASERRFVRIGNDVLNDVSRELGNP